MAELMQEYWIVLVIALLIGVLVAWWVLVGTRRTKVEIERAADDTPAKRNQALIDAPPAATPSAQIPPPTPEGMAGIGEAIAVAAEPAPAVPAASLASTATVAGADDLTRIKGLGPKISEQLRGLGVTTLAQIAAWDDADIDRIDALLGRFQGRIRRDDWPTQARLLADGDTSGYEAKFGKL